MSKRILLSLILLAAASRADASCTPMPECALDNQGPVVNLTSPSSGPAGNAPVNLTLSATASDPDGMVVSVTFYSGANILSVDTTAPYSYVWTGVPAGSYSITAVAEDNDEGTTTSAAANVTVASSSNPAPTVSLTAPADGASFNTGATWTISANASDANGISNVKFYVNGGLVATDSTSPYSTTYSTPTAGSYAVSAVATDTLGASASAAANVTVTSTNWVSSTRSYVYDQYGRVCKTINPESGATIVDYDGASNVAWSADGQPYLSTTTCDRELVATGAKTFRTYDAMNRVKQVTTPGGTADVTTTYYLDGQVASVTAANPGGYNVTTAYAYNKRRMLTSETQTNGAVQYILSYAYNGNGHQVALGYPDTEVVTYTVDALGRPTKVEGNTNVYASNVQYYPNGAMSSFKYGSLAGGGPTHTMTRNLRGLPSRSQDIKGTNVILDDEYTYDASGNVAEILDRAQNIDKQMSYDALDRLTVAVADNLGTPAVGDALWGTGTYTYDALDNLRSNDQNNHQYRYNYDSNWRLLNIKSPAGASLFTFGYDGQGNQTTKGSQIRVFDSANRLNQISGVQVYRYDGLGHRVQATDADTKTTFWTYSKAGQVLYTSEARRNRNLAYIYLNGSQIGTRAVAFGSGAVTVRYQMTDSLGSPVADTTIAGSGINRTSFSPWGEVSPSTVDGTGFTGHVMDASTGLTYMEQRYYDPLVARFLSTDPVQPSTSTAADFNRFRYAENNPFFFTDPDGRQVAPARTPNQAAAQVFEGARIVMNRTAEKVKEAAPRVAQAVIATGEMIGGAVAVVESLGQSMVDDDVSNVAKGMAGFAAIEDGYRGLQNAFDGGNRRTLVGEAAEYVGGPTAGDVGDLVSGATSGTGLMNSLDELVTVGGKRAAAEAAQNGASTVNTIMDVPKKAENK